MTKTSFRPLTALLSCVASLSFVTFPIHAADTLSSADKLFVMKASQGGMTEVQLSQLAVDKSMSQDVKMFASKMVLDHGKANKELGRIASSKSLIPSDKLEEKNQAMVDKLGKLSGAEFDKSYVGMMVDAHKNDDALFMAEAASGQDTDIKTFASNTDETVKMHLSMIKSIQSKMQ